MDFLFVILVIVIVLIIYFVSDYFGPGKIRPKSSSAFGIDCMRARDLIVQEFDSKGNLWATRGFIIYCLRKGKKEFVRLARVPSGFSIFWFNNFKIIRKFTLRSECVEMTISEEGKITAFASGIIWYSTGLGQNFQKVMKLDRFGLQIGRGIMSTGILQANKSEIFFGEYFNNPERTSVRVYKFNGENKTWETSYNFKPGQIRHIHALQSDPFTGKLWICTGDEDKEAMIGWSDDDYKSINPIGQGSQIWRACQLVFTKEAVYWGTDTGSDLAGIYRWDRSTKDLIMLHRTNGAVFFGTRLTNGTIIMSTDREGFPNEKDDRTRLFILNQDDRITTIPFGIWKYKKSGFRFNFAKLRFQRNQGNNFLTISVLNQKEFHDGDLLLFDEETLASSL